MRSYLVQRVVKQSLFLLAIMLSAVFLTAMTGSTSTHAVASHPKLFISGDNTFYMYVIGGEKISTSFVKSSQVEPLGLEAYDIAVSLEGPGLETQRCVLSKDIAVNQGCAFPDVTAPQTGIYRVVFKLPDTAQPYPQVSPTVRWGRNMFSWEIAIKDGQVEKTGRVWSELYGVRQPIESTYVADLTYHYVSENGAIYKATYKGYNGQISTFSADAVGIRSGEGCVSSYQSINVSDTKRSPSFGSCGGSYKLFFEQPSGDLPRTATRPDGKGKDWISPVLVPPKVSELKFTSDTNGDMQSGKISYKLENFVGQYTVDIDTTGDGNFSSKEDIRIKRTMKKVDNSVQTVQFDGVDARGQVVPASQQISVRINVEKVAEIHLVNADVEGRAGGLELIRLSGENAPSGRMCWNDTELSPLANAVLQTSTPDGRNCPDSTTAARHGWPYATDSWGDLRYIDDWAYTTATLEGVSKIQYPENVDPVLSVRNNDLMRIIGIVMGVLLIGVVGVFTTMIISKRRKHAQRLKDAENAQSISAQNPDGPKVPPPFSQ